MDHSTIIKPIQEILRSSGHLASPCHRLPPPPDQGTTTDQERASTDQDYDFPNGDEEQEDYDEPHPVLPSGPPQTQVWPPEDMEDYDEPTVSHTTYNQPGRG